ncbi:hypothetical protein [Leifsonia aquatica]|uniref:hypothetical protein n=1 Tax=Leifsonia aquatica TaxID=144185 RepID=UPI0037F74832
MDLIDMLDKLRAAEEGHAVRRTRYRHVHLETRPLVIVGYYLAGEQDAPVGIMWGTDRDHPHLMSVPEPRNRDDRFHELKKFAEALVDFIERTPAGRCPQLVFANDATAAWLLRMVGRWTRYLPVDGPHPVDPAIRKMGNYLSLLNERWEVPGGATVLTMTSQLSAVYANGQLASEDQNLRTQLAWIQPPPGLSGADAARVAELEPPVGPLSHPDWDDKVLMPAISEYGAAKKFVEAAVAEAAAQVHRRVRRELLPGWNVTWDALEVLRRIPEAPHAANRWAADVNSWSKQAPNVASGDRRFRIHRSPAQNADRLRAIERAIDEFEHHQALDDPAILARHEAAGRAITGTVIESHPDAKAQVGPKKAARPLIRIRTTTPPRIPIGTAVRLTADERVIATILDKTDDDVTLQITNGANTTPTRGRVPTRGAEVGFTSTTPGGFVRRDEPEPGAEYVDPTPWTHRVPMPAGADSDG